MGNGITLPYSWQEGDVLYAAELDADFQAITDLLGNFNNRVVALENGGNLGGAMVQQMNISWPEGVSDIQTGNYILVLSADYQMTLTSLFYTVGTNGGSFDVQVLNAGTEVSGFTFTADQSQITEITATDNNIVNEGYQLVLVISNIQGAPKGPDIQININKTISQGPQTTDYDIVDENGAILVDENGNEIIIEVTT